MWSIHIDFYFLCLASHFWPTGKFLETFYPFLWHRNNSHWLGTFKAPLKKLFHAAGTCLRRRHTTNKNSCLVSIAQWLCDVTNSWRPNPYSTCVCIHSPISVRFFGCLLPDVKEKSIRSYRRKWERITILIRKSIRRSFGTVEKGVPLNLQWWIILD